MFRPNRPDRTARPGITARRLVHFVAVIPLISLALAGVGSTPAESQPPTGYQSGINFANMKASWSGTFKSTWPTASSTQYPRGIPGDTATAEITWSASVTVTPAQFEAGLGGALSTPRVYWKYTQLRGTYHYVNQEHKVDCTAQLSERPGYYLSTNDEALVAWHRDTNKYEVQATAPFYFTALTTGLSRSDPCEPFAYWSEPPSTDTAFYQTFEQDQMASPGGPPVSYDRPLIAWDSPDQDATSSVSSDLTISLAAGPSCTCGCSTSTNSFRAGSGEVYPLGEKGKKVYLENTWPGTPSVLPQTGSTPVEVGQGLKVSPVCKGKGAAAGPWKFSVQDALKDYTRGGTPPTRNT